MAVNRYYSSTAVATTVTGALSSGAGSANVAATTGFPTSFPFTGVIDEGTLSEELVEVTNVAGLTLTVNRGVNGTAAVSHSVGATFRHCVSARDFTEPQEHIAASSGVHGLTGTVVGTTDAQVLTNKTLAAPAIADLSGAQHLHTSAAAGGQLTDAALSTPVTVPKGGTGQTSLTASRFLVGNGASAVDLSKVVPTGTVVGTSDSQTLTTKTIALGSNTVSGTKAQFDTACTDADFASLAGAEVLTNKDLTSSTNTFPAVTHARAYQSSAQTLTTSVWAAVTMTSEDDDSTTTMHDTGTNTSRMIAPTAGAYLISAQVSHTAASGGVRRMQVRKNAAGSQAGGTSTFGTITDNSPSGALGCTLNGSAVVRLAANDYVEMFAFQSSGGNNTLVTGNDSTFVSLTKLGS